MLNYSYYFRKMPSKLILINPLSSKSNSPFDNSIGHSLDCSLTPIKVCKSKWILGLFANNNNNNNNTNGQCQYSWCCHHGTAIAKVHPVHLTECSMSTRWLPTFGPSRSARANWSTGGQLEKLHSPSPSITTQPDSWYSFYHPTEGKRLSRPS